MNTEQSNKSDSFDVEPYRILFPIGILCSFVGILLWIFVQFRMISFYPNFAHGNLMYFGFMWAFIAGFLMTAIPKMTSTFTATIAEVSIAILLCMLQLTLNLRNEILPSSYLVIFQQLFLIYFITRRFTKAKKMPFASILFIPAALLISLAGSLIYSFNADRSVLLLLSGEAFILNLILGLGSRLIPVISRLPNALMPNQASQEPLQFFNTLVLVVMFNLTFITQLLGFENFSLFSRTLIITYVLFKNFSILTKPVKWTAVGVGLKISTALLPLGTLLSAPYFGSPLAGLHVLYIGGFVLVTLLISTRVVLAHGGESLDYEVSSKRVMTFTACLVSASILRYSAGYQVTSLSVQIAIVLFIVSIGAWSVKMLNSAK